MRSSTMSQHRPSRRTVLRIGGALAGAAAGGAVLSGYASSAEGRTRVRFLQNKPEAVPYFRRLVNRFNAAQSEFFVVHDSTPAPLVPQFVRGTPPDLGCYNYNLETSNFLARGALSDLAELPEARRIDDRIQDLVGQYAQYGSETSVLPYSATAAGVIYNKALFERADVAVPTTWSELLAACRTFRARGIVPIVQTYKDLWTISQGLFDYVTGSALDVTGFFARLKEQGADAGPGAEVSFGAEFRDAAEKMLALGKYTNRDAASRGYYDGNVAFARGRAAMYLQGPWALGEVEKINPELRLGTFALPATEDPKDVKVRVNLDLALWVPDAARQPEGARAFLRYLMRQPVMDAYNAEFVGWSTTRNAPPVADDRVEGLQPYLDSGRFFQGAGTYLPGAIPHDNYLQKLVTGGNAEAFLNRLDEDWARYAQRNL
ncbi:extracellular solute-binding protein [Streptomyces sp. LHD-70]|uniref:ABC transporter substrate-binding protein n=1 Tax=Streptomyces sp. LHD-70 TaxID=3072140 RepID=UPI00280E7158|nr:extracellular solute-binding protein [Streptomyces sp. LHD-70]MDQ8703829.1 extracellular solute-binding protein [Streptomyces sp. LHD-70]